MPKEPDDRLPPPGSWADVARIMASIPQDPNEPPIDWNEWKDRQKDEDMARDEAMGM